jgi:hypothetical protein
MGQFAGKVRLGAPAISNALNTLTWLKSFITKCNGCRIDFVPIHRYAPATAIDYFKSYITQARTAAGGRPLWITEFVPSDTEKEIIHFLQVILPWLDGQDYVERYSYFFADKLISGNSLSAVGRAYATI